MGDQWKATEASRTGDTYLKVVPCECGEPGCDTGYDDVTDEVIALRAEVERLRQQLSDTEEGYDDYRRRHGQLLNHALKLEQQPKRIAEWLRATAREVAEGDGGWSAVQWLEHEAGVIEHGAWKEVTR